MELLGLGSYSDCSAFGGADRLFLTAAVPFIHSCPQWTRVLIFSTSLPTLGIIWLSDSSHPSGSELISPCGFTFPFFHVFIGHLCICFFKKYILLPGWCSSVDWAWACKPKGRQFNSQSGHMPGLPARSPVGDAWEATTHRCLPLSSFPLSLKINK